MTAEELHNKLVTISNITLENRLEKVKNNYDFWELPDKGDFTTPCKKKYYSKHLQNDKSAEDIKSVYMDLLKASFEDNYYFFGCVLKVAINHYEKRAEEEKNPVLGITKKDIYQTLLNELEDIDTNLFFDTPFDVFLDPEDYKESYPSFSELLPYIFLHWECYLENPIWLNEYHKKKEYLKDKINDSYTEQSLDITTEEKTTAKQKVLFLNELGIIDYLNNDKTQKMNPNKMSNLLSKVTGEKPSTLRPSIAAILDDNPTKNNPYIDDENVENARNFLNRKGYVLKKTN